MTVSVTSNKIVFPGNASNTTFAFPFAMPGGISTSQAALVLLVTYTDPNGVQSLISFGPGTSQYQLTLNAPISPNPTGVGGVVTYNPGGTPIPSGSSLTIQRLLPQIQATSFQNQGNLWQQAIEQAMDYIAMLSQQDAALQSIAIVAPSSDPSGLNYILPSQASRASKALTFDASGNVTAGVIPSTGVISSPMAPVVGAASLSAGRTAFGLGSIATENVGAGLFDYGDGFLRATHFVQPIVANRTVVATDHFSNFVVTGPVSFTLPLTTGLPNSFEFFINSLNPGGVVTVNPNAADKFRISGITYATGQSLSIGVGKVYRFTTDIAGTWYVTPIIGFGAGPTPSFFKNLTISALAGSLTATVQADGVGLIDGINNFTIAVSGGVNLGSSGLGGLDTGTVAANTTYYIWVIYNPQLGTQGLLASLQSVANGTFLSHLPSGYTFYGRVGAVITNAGPTGFKPTVQYGRKVQYTTPQGLATGTAGTYSATAPVWASVAWTGLAPSATAGRVTYLVANGFNSGALANVILAPNNTYTGVTSTLPPPIALLSGTAQTDVVELTQEGGNIFWASSAAGGAIFVLGWEDNI